MFRALIICVGVLITTVTLKAQQPTPSPDLSTRPKQISGGVLNGKATSLPKPTYPAAARAVGASGAVSVQVLIDENGDVVAAEAVSGHPLLRAAAVEAARGAKFSPTQLQGNPVKVSGIVTYNFVGPLSPSGFGFMITFAERSGKFIGHTSPATLASQLPPDWLEEKEILTSLTYEQIVVEEKTEAKPPVQPARIEQNESNKQKFTVKGDINFSAASVGPEKKLDAKSTAALANLHAMVQRRMSANDRTAWNYELGSALGALLADFQDGSKLRSHVATVESIVVRAPAEANEGNLQSLKDFLESTKAGAAKNETPADLRVQVEQLANLRY